jgi:ubiquinone/menaquinone biosynthesis C-methylase UbiE
MKSSFREVPIERVRTYWDERPCNIRHSPKAVGTREYFDEVEARKYFVEPHIPRFAQFERWKGRRVLEVGCGIGTDTINFARHGATVTAVDLSPQSLELARQRAGVYGLADRIRFVAGNAEILSELLPAETYDLVYSFGVLHHTPHPERAISELRKFLRPGGVLKIMVYHRRSWKVLSILVREGRGRFWRLDDVVAKHSEAQTGCPVTFTYLRGQARDLVERQGFRVTDVFCDHIFPYLIPEYVRYRYRRVWHFRALPDSWFRWLEKRLGWHLCLTAEAR